MGEMVGERWTERKTRGRENERRRRRGQRGRDKVNEIKEIIHIDM
jgi:hypothetical protein